MKYKLRDNLYFKMTAKSIDEFLENSTSYTALNINIRKSKEDYFKLRHIIQTNTTLTSLYIDGGYTTGWKDISKDLKNNTTLTSFSLRFIDGFSKYDARAFSEVIKINKSLTTLILSCCGFGDTEGIHILRALKNNNTITTFDLSANYLGIGSALVISDILKNNNTLNSLRVSNNKFRGKGASAIAEALEVNTTLTNLNLRNCHLGEYGKISILNSLKINSTLTDLDLYSGHYLRNNNVDNIAIEVLKVNNTLIYLDLPCRQEELIKKYTEYNRKYKPWLNSVGPEIFIYCLDNIMKNWGLTNFDIIPSLIG